MVHDMILGFVLQLPLWVLAALTVPGKLQTWLLFKYVSLFASPHRYSLFANSCFLFPPSNALSQGVVLNQILEGSVSSSSAPTGPKQAKLVAELAELKNLVVEQQTSISALLANSQQSSGFKRGHSVESVANSVSSYQGQVDEEEDQQRLARLSTLASAAQQQIQQQPIQPHQPQQQQQEQQQPISQSRSQPNLLSLANGSSAHDAPPQQQFQQFLPSRSVEEEDSGSDAGLEF